MTFPRRGFTLVSRVDEGYIVDLPAAASTNQPLAIGDAVTLLNGTVIPATAGQDPTNPGFGVIMEVLTTAGLPLTGREVKYIASGGVGRVRVNTDPTAEYVVRLTSSAGQSVIGKNVFIDVSAANAVTGLSGQAVTQASASINDLFKVIDWYGGERIGGVDPIGSNLGVVVRWNRHINRAGTASA